MISESVVDLSRFQFAMTAMYHFIFVPLTLGMAFLLAIMETTYVISGKEIYKDMTKFWGKLFGINFALGVTTGLTMEFQFGTNWAYYSHYVGDIFGAPLAIEGLMAFFLESTFIGLFFFGWDRLPSKVIAPPKPSRKPRSMNICACCRLPLNACAMPPRTPIRRNCLRIGSTARRTCRITGRS